VFTGTALAGLVIPGQTALTWHMVQHEGFHQFVHAAIGEGVPQWANEGLAEYFGEGQWTGDQFLVGQVPADRVKRLKVCIRNGTCKPLRDMMVTSNEIWNSDLRGENYDVAWSMVYFLAHGDNERYQQPFMGFLRDVSRKTPWPKAWQSNFGGDIDAFEQRWKELWTALPEDATADLDAQVALSTLTSFYARALSQQQKFDKPEDFFAAAEAGTLKANAQDWLPPTLLTDALKKAPDVGTWSFKGKANWRPLVLTAKSGNVFEGRFKIESGRVKSVTVEPVKKRK
jgi:hypothetical protein